MIKGIFLDLYGTLIVTGGKSASSWLDEFYACLQSYGLSISKEDFTDQCQAFFSQAEPQRRNDGLTIYERRIKALCTELGLNIDRAQIQQTATNTIEAANKNCYLDPDCPWY